MIPNPPPRRPQLGFLYLPPYRVQGLSVAGEHSAVQIPELDVCFDMGVCPRAMLASKFVALTHGHMDHTAAIAYYFSQRSFQGMGTGTLCCPESLAGPLHALMEAWVDVEGQRTPYHLVPMRPDREIEIKPKTLLRAFATSHTVPSVGYVVVERRTKLKPELAGLSQEQIVQRKRRGEEVTHSFDVPLICYTGDTMWGDWASREDVLKARILITECTFIEPAHRKRANVGKHLHLDHIGRLLDRSEAEAVVLTHLSRRTHVREVRRQIDARLSQAQRARVHVLMDHRANRTRFEHQSADAQMREAPEGSEVGGSEQSSKADVDEP